MTLTANIKSGLVIFFFSFALFADDENEKEIPSLEFLEFLGSFATDNGEWVDPMEIQEMLENTNLNEPQKEKADDKSSIN